MKSKKEDIDNTAQSLQVIPGVGPKLAKKLYDIGIKRISVMDSLFIQYKKLCLTSNKGKRIPSPLDVAIPTTAQ